VRKLTAGFQAPLPSRGLSSCDTAWNVIVLQGIDDGRPLRCIRPIPGEDLVPSLLPRQDIVSVLKRNQGACQGLLFSLRSLSSLGSFYQITLHEVTQTSDLVFAPIVQIFHIFGVSLPTTSSPAANAFPSPSLCFLAYVKTATPRPPPRTGYTVRSKGSVPPATLASSLVTGRLDEPPTRNAVSFLITSALLPPLLHTATSPWARGFVLGIIKITC